MLSGNVVLGWRAWARNRSLLSLLAATVVCCVLIGLTSEVIIAIPPFLTGRGVDVSNAAVVPLCVVIVQGWCLSRRDTRLEAGSERRTALADCLLSTMPAVLVGIVAYVGNLPVGMVATRNTVGLSGVTLLANALGVTRLSSLPATIWVLMSLLAGSTASFEAPWSWPVKDRTDVLSAVLSVALCLLGISASLVKPRPWRNRG